MEMVERFRQTETGKERFMRFTHYLQTPEGHGVEEKEWSYFE